jgi:hypothetical protein
MNTLEETWIISLERYIDFESLNNFFKNKNNPFLIFLTNKYVDISNFIKHKFIVLVVKQEDLGIYYSNKPKVYCLETGVDYYI